MSSRSQWQRGLRRSSTAARPLRLWVRIACEPQGHNGMRAWADAGSLGGGQGRESVLCIAHRVRPCAHLCRVKWGVDSVRGGTAGIEYKRRGGSNCTVEWGSANWFWLMDALSTRMMMIASVTIVPECKQGAWINGIKKSHRGHGCFVSVLCCVVEVSVMGWSLVQRSPTDCGEPLCVI